MNRKTSARAARRAISAAALAAGLLASSGALAQAAPAGPAPAAPAVPAAREARPNVLIWMLDDVGFAQFSAFGGLVPTPNIDRVARMGLRYSNYHTTPICSASRAAMLSGRNSHSVHIGGHAASARPFPGYDSHIPASAGSIAENLRQSGYTTFALGKWDHLPTEDASPAGPFRQWPAGQGFDKFYGFLAADADNWTPILVRDTAPIDRPAGAAYHLNADLADQAIAMISTRDAGARKAPFFMYWATGTAHAPHHAPQAWIDRFKGKFDMGWDKARETILRSQKAQGLVPRSAVLAPRPEGMAAWASLTAEQQRLYARQMEVFAASMAYADDQFGRILDTLEARGELANTIVVVTSDNGASAEGAYNGLANEAMLVTNEQASMADNMRFFDRWGGPETYPHYAFGWAVAGNTPFRYYKTTAHEGGTRVPFVMAWPKGIAARGETRGQFTHVSDVAPTILEAAGVPLANVVNNVRQTPMEGTSFTYSFADPAAKTRKPAQYFEMYGNKGLWSDGWSIVTTHRINAWDIGQRGAPTAPWELYDLTRDPGQTQDLAAKHPERVAAMAREFEAQAARFNVNPIGSIGDGSAEIARQAQDRFRARGGVWRYSRPERNIPGLMAPPLAFRSFTMRASLDLPSAAASGPLFAYGGRLGGLALYLRGGKPVLVSTTLKGDSAELAAGQALPAGASRIELRFANAAAQPGAEADHRVTILADGKVLGEGVLRQAIPPSFGISETFSLGVDDGSQVLPGAPARLDGAISDITFDFTAPPPP